jgi:hypothetical protein
MARLAIFCAAILGSLSASGSLSAQRTVDVAQNANLAVGYVVNAPQQLLGLGAWTVPSSLHPWGLYADVKLRVNSPARDELDRSLTPDQAEALGDNFFKDDSAWTTTNLALVRVINPDLALYLGAGVSWRTTYFQYVRDVERGPAGQYWVEDDEQSGTFANVMAGALFRATPRWGFQFGAETAPAGATVGVHLRLR